MLQSVTVYDLQLLLHVRLSAETCRQNWWLGVECAVHEQMCTKKRSDFVLAPRLGLHRLRLRAARGPAAWARAETRAPVRLLAGQGTSSLPQ